MTTLANKDRSHESIINDTLARFLRERCNLSAVAETLHDGRRPDIIVRLSEGPVILEIEIEPALTVEADALSRLGMEIDGRRVQNVFAVTVPGRLRSTSQQHLYERMASATLEWQEWRIDGTSGPKLSGTAIELGNAGRSGQHLQPAIWMKRLTPLTKELGALVPGSIPPQGLWAGSRRYLVH